MQNPLEKQTHKHVHAKRLSCEAEHKVKPGSAGPVIVVWHPLRVACHHENGHRQLRSPAGSPVNVQLPGNPLSNCRPTPRRATVQLPLCSSRLPLLQSPETNYPLHDVTGLTSPRSLGIHEERAKLPARLVAHCKMLAGLLPFCRLGRFFWVHLRQILRHLQRVHDREIDRQWRH